MLAPLFMSPRLITLSVTLHYESNTSTGAGQLNAEMAILQYLPFLYNLEEVSLENVHDLTGFLQQLGSLRHLEGFSIAGGSVFNRPVLRELKPIDWSLGGVREPFPALRV